MSSSQDQPIVAFMRAWVGLLAFSMTCFVLVLWLFPDYFASDEPGEVLRANPARELLVGGLLSAYAASLWVTALRIKLTKLRSTVVLILSGSLLWWPLMLFGVMRDGVILEAILPLLQFLVILGLPGWFAVLLQTKWRQRE